MELFLFADCRPGLFLIDFLFFVSLFYSIRKRCASCTLWEGKCLAFSHSLELSCFPLETNNPNQLTSIFVGPRKRKIVNHFLRFCPRKYVFVKCKKRNWIYRCFVLRVSPSNKMPNDWKQNDENKFWTNWYCIAQLLLIECTTLKLRCREFK